MIEAEINRLRAELLHKDQEGERMAAQLAAEKEERERAQRKVGGGARGGGASGVKGRLRLACCCMELSCH